MYYLCGVNDNIVRWRNWLDATRYGNTEGDGESPISGK